jgi:hypothetical protein
VILGKHYLRPLPLLKWHRLQPVFRCLDNLVAFDEHLDATDNGVTCENHNYANLLSNGGPA